jgi:chemotaxis protein methyltransferase CheR
VAFAGAVGAKRVTPPAELERFAASIVSRLGFRVDQHNREPVEQLLRRRLQHTGCSSVDAYIARFEEDRFASGELTEIALELTVPETYFFRHPEQFQALVETALPERIKARQAVRRLHVLSAGCATGEEAYSLAAQMSAMPGLAGWDIDITGVDVNPRHLQAARAARYSAWSLRAVSQEQRSALFRAQGKAYALRPEIIAAVRFQARNLLDDAPGFWLPDFFDVIFCRNVIIYFSPAAVHALVDRLTRSLAPGGFLFLGPSETLRGISQAFHLRHTQGAFYYQRRLPHERPEGPTALAAAALPPRPAAASQRQYDPAWAADIMRAGTRIAAIADRAQRSPDDGARGKASAQQESPDRSTEQLGAVRELLRDERFEDAHRLIGSLPRGAGTDPDALLLEALILANRNDLTGAEQLCEQLLARDELRPGAHYLLAFCQERRGDYLSAAEQDQTAIYLDPAFAMPHLHLGLLAARLGDLSTARRELAEALPLLEREDASRVLLFGGGFDRGALIRLCQTQLERCQGGT